MIVDNNTGLVVDNQGIVAVSDVETIIGKTRTELLQGTLELLILRTLANGPRHGWGISKRIRETSRDALQVNQGSLYPALYRLEERGQIEPEWGISPEGRRAKFYRLTDAGRQQLTREEENWRAFASAVEEVLGAES